MVASAVQYSRPPDVAGLLGDVPTAGFVPVRGLQFKPADRGAADSSAARQDLRNGAGPGWRNSRSKDRYPRVPSDPSRATPRASAASSRFQPSNIRDNRPMAVVA